MSVIEKDWLHRAQNVEISSSQYPWPDWVGSILAGRGLKSLDEQNLFLYPKLSNLKDPFSLVDMDRSVQRIVKAFLNQEKICIYADFDLDGTSGLALLWTAFRKLGFQNVIGFQPRRLKEGYGFHAEVVDQLAEQGVSLILTVDVGITGHEAALRAINKNIDVIITDHHQPSESLPRAYAVVNPNRNDCQSGLGYLSGAGVGFYLLRALRRELQDHLSEQAKTWDLKSILDFFAIATITDMVPLIDDNRILVKHGLVQLSQTQWPGLRALLQELDLWGRPLLSQDVGIRFAPKLNALSRLDQEILPLDLMIADSDVKAQHLVSHVLKSNQSRIEFQLEAEVEARRLLKEWKETNFIFLYSDKFHPGVIGLIANKLSQEKNVPIFVGALEVASGKIVGSSRAPEGTVNLVEALSQAEEFFERFGGHPQAAGFEFHIDNSEKVISKLRDFFSKTDGFEQSRPTISYDLELSLDQLSPAFLKWFEFLGPFGQSFESPLFRVNQLKLDKIKTMKGQHLKLSFSQDLLTGGLFQQEAVYFSPPQGLESSLNIGEVYDLLVEPQANYFGGKKNMQFLVRDLKRSRS